ncbi:MAG TPA: plastocyanin/azurin family copper-binding protein [Gemmatimonadaceae bacterium]|jgi:plastocyanin|nr:plastocyanin/azurin family copper-binding protein [Gemmatimonadaceae bacterium]
MRFHGLALVTSAAVLVACGGGENKATDTTKAPPAAAATTPAPAPTTAAPAAAANAAAKVAATGATHDIKMIGDDKGYRFEPAAVTIKSGDAIRFTMVSGGPHNVAFDPATVPADSKNQLDANMDQKISELSSPMMMNPNETYTISFGGVKPGVYPFHCTPHLAMGMKGTITVQ